MNLPHSRNVLHATVTAHFGFSRSHVTSTTRPQDRCERHCRLVAMSTPTRTIVLYVDGYFVNQGTRRASSRSKKSCCPARGLLRDGGGVPPALAEPSRSGQAITSRSGCRA
jgi:hypothetical protein